MKYLILGATLASLACTYTSLKLDGRDCVAQGQDGCDGADNDCDGVFDEDCCEPEGAMRRCGSDTACVRGEQTCTDGLWGECLGEIPAEPESCTTGNTKDLDCDGLPGCQDMDCYGEPDCQLTCTATNLLPCNTSTPVDTNGPNTMSWYSCLPWDETGGEVIYSFTADEHTYLELSLEAEPVGTDIDVLVLRGGCDPHACEAHADRRLLDFVAEANETYYIVLDSFEGHSGTAELTTWCSPIDEQCTNGLDDDGDGDVDCADDKCIARPACTANECLGPAQLFCNQRVVGSPTSDAFQAYPACGAIDLGGPEQAWSFVPGESGEVTFELDPGDGAPLQAMLLEGTCEPSAPCTLLDGTPVPVTAGTTYYVMVDGAEGARDFTLRAACAFEDCINDRDDDDDGLADGADWLDCGGPGAMEHCLNGYDDDTNGHVDCVDANCTNEPECQACPVEGPVYSYIQCGTRFAASTADEHGTKVLNNYGCAPGDDTSAAEHVRTFTAPGDGTIHIEVDAHDGGDAHIFLLRDSCNTSACVAHDINVLEHPVSEGETYYIAVDGDRVYAFDFALECPFEDCHRPGDQDDNGLEGCEDPACVDMCGSGVCEPTEIREITCSSSTFTDDIATAPNELTSYVPCMGATGTEVVTGGEHIYHFRFDDDTWLSVDFYSLGTSLFLLEGACESWRCTRSYPLEIFARAGRDYYLVVDSFEDGDTTYSLDITCGDPMQWPPEDCANGIDDDHNGLIDCDDDQAACYAWKCEPGVCIPPMESKNAGGPLGCGSWLASTTGGGTQDGPVTDNIDSYSCNAWGALGPERAHSLILDHAADVTIHLNPVAHQKWRILDNHCHADACIAEYGDGPVHLEADRQYYLVIDGVEDEAAGPYTVGVQCN